MKGGKKVRRPPLIRETAQAEFKEWQEIFWAMADGDPVAYKVVKGMEINEFFTSYDIWQARAQRASNQNAKPPKSN